MKKVLTGVLVVVVVCGTLFLGACDKKDSAASSGGKVISVFTWGFPAEKLAREKQVARYMELHPDVTINLEVSPDYDRKLAAMLTSGDGPDVFETSDDWFHLYGKDLTDLRPFVERDKVDLSIYYDRSLSGFRHDDGKLESLPIGLCPFALAVNTDIFDAAGITIPEGSWTWDDVIKASQAVTKGEGLNKVYGLTDHWVWQQILPFYYGGGYYAKDYKSLALDSPETIKGIQFFADLMYKHKIIPTFEESSGLLAEQRFFGGRAALMPINLWDIYNFAANIGDSFHWKLAMMPTMTESGLTPVWSIVEGYGIWDGSKNKDTAWDFIKWATTDPESLTLASVAAIPPTHDAAKIFTAYDFGTPLNLEVFINTIPRAILSIPGGPFQQVNDTINEYWDSLKRGEGAADVTAGVKAITERAQPILRSLGIN
ncbi:sugar ABC transporter substrate-binding protein [Spirochaetia bacterium]|nr:sugar ABC transporter substrate-binding protein [Spirochaetia bacterium]